MTPHTTPTSFEKILSANDTGITGGHMGGILIPRTETGLIALFPKLDPKEYNPSVFLDFKGPNGATHKLRFVYYNNKLHGKGTRNEYRLTYLTDFLRNSNSKVGDAFRITRDENGNYEMEVVKKACVAPSSVIKLRGWNRVC
jgi:hypothetical protein